MPFSNFNITSDGPTPVTVFPASISRPPQYGYLTAREVQQLGLFHCRPFAFTCPKAKTYTFPDTSTLAVIKADCSIVTIWSTGQDASSTTEPLPTFPTWPPWASIVPVTTSVNEPQPTDNGVIVPCTAWFFFVCISWGEIRIGGWFFVLPPGIYPPGPPPGIKWPTGFRIDGILPRWPKITIGPNNQITTEGKPECETRTAKVCTTTTIFSATTTRNGVTTTTRTVISSVVRPSRGAQ
ncbi:hypothetical protein OQA88_7934 [Cercophora sp. LCS_1]